MEAEPESHLFVLHKGETKWAIEAAFTDEEAELLVDVPSGDALTDEDFLTWRHSIVEGFSPRRVCETIECENTTITRIYKSK